MRLRFRLNDKTIELDVNTNWNILFLKQRICLEFEVDSQSHFLSFDNTQISDWDKVSTHRFPDNALLTLHSHRSVNHFYVLCYMCNNVTQAIVNTLCNICKASNFTAETPSQLSNDVQVCGKCATSNCNGTTASIRFSCSRDNSHSPVVFLKQVVQNVDHVICIACLSSDCDVIVSFCPTQGHALCLHCFCIYAESYLSDRRFEMVPAIGYTLPCPIACTNSFINDVHFFRILGIDFYSRYKEIAAKQVCYADGFVNCPQCDAVWELQPDTHDLPLVFCDLPYGCGAEFCTRCRYLITPSIDAVNAHTLPLCQCHTINSTAPGSILEAFESKTSNMAWSGITMSPSDLSSLCAIAVTCKPCPTCRSQTNKNGGCNHIHCIVCGNDWCWICLKKWTTDCQANHWF